MFCQMCTEFGFGSAYERCSLPFGSPYPRRFEQAAFKKKLPFEGRQFTHDHWEEGDDDRSRVRMRV
jgi:hypothetical protein